MEDAMAKARNDSMKAWVTEMLGEIEAEKWSVLVRWCAPKLAEEDPEYLIDLIAREALSRSEGEESRIGPAMAEILKEVGVKVVFG
jgi:hypothetical protein